MRLTSALTTLLLPISLVLAQLDSQIPMTDSSAPRINTGLPTLQDLLTIETSFSIYYSYARETSLSQIFSDEELRTSVLVPSNRAVMALARKPHQGKEEDGGDKKKKGEIEISEEEFEEASKRNVVRWVSGHIIPTAPLDFTQASYPTLLEGHSISIKSVKGSSEDPDWKKVVLNKGIRIVGVKEGSNGVLYLVDECVDID